MDDAEKQAALAEWLSARPQSVQILAAEFPLASRLECHGRVLHVVGWTEDDKLIVAEPDPAADWDAAMNAKEYLCAGHYR